MGTFISDPESTLPGPKRDLRSIPAGADRNQYIDADAYNAIRSAALDLRAAHQVRPAQSWDVPDEAGRLALSPTVSDLGRVARQASDGSLWACLNHAPATWAELAPLDYAGKNVTVHPGGATQLIRQKLYEVVSVADFGAVGDGTTDDSAAINLALSTVGGTNKLLSFVPGAVYLHASTMTFTGKTRIRGNGATIKPAASLNAPAIQAVGADGALLYDISIDGLRMDGTNRPVDSTGDFGAFRFFFVGRLSITNCSWYKTHDALYLRGVEDFIINGITVDDCRSGMVGLLKGTKRGVISNLSGTSCGEIVDFFDNEDIVVTGFEATGQVDPAHLNEAFDLSTSRRVTISNGTAKGFARGVLLKSEAGQTNATGPAWTDIRISNFTCLDQLYDGINAQASVTTYDTPRRLQVSNVIVKSTVGTSGGIVLSSNVATSLKGDDAEFTNCTVDVPGIAFKASNFENVKVRNSRLVTAGGVSVDLLTGGSPRILVENCDVRADGGATSDNAISAALNDDIVLRGNRIHAAVGTALRVTNSKRPVVQGNVVSFAGMYGIYLNWVSATYLDARALCTVSENVVRDWSQAASSRSAYQLTLTGVADGTYEGCDYHDNSATLSDGATLQAPHYGWLITKPAGVLFNRSKLTNNLVGSRIVTASAFNGHAAWDGVGNLKTGNLPCVGYSDTLGADVGDANKTLTHGTDDPVQRWATTLTANRTITLSMTNAVNGARFRVVRTGLGAFTLAVGSVKTIPSATAAYVEVTCDGSAWVLTGYGAL